MQKITIWSNPQEVIHYVVHNINNIEFNNYFKSSCKRYIREYCSKNKNIAIQTSQSINDFYNKYHNDIIEQYKQKQIYTYNYLSTKRELLNKANNKRLLDYNNVFTRISYASTLTDNDKLQLYNEYKQRYEQLHPKQVSQTEHIKSLAKVDTFHDKLIKFVKEHANDEPLEFDDFKKLTSGWSPGRRSINKWYEIYRTEYFRQPGTTITYRETPNTNLIGFKSKNKVQTLQQLYPNINEPTHTIPSSFPLKQNIKQYQLHKVSPRYTWLIDLMFVDKLAYLVAINVNTRYLCVEIINDEINENKFAKNNKKSTTYYLRALQKMIDSGIKIKYLLGDGECAFNSKFAWDNFYKPNNIEFDTVPRQQIGCYPDFMKKEQKQTKTNPMHSSLGIVDRVIRTLRDMAYNMKIGIITPNVMNELVKQYNNSPHKTLSKYAGADVSPRMVNNDYDLECYIVRRICQDNYNIMNSPGFKLNTGAAVKVYNERDAMSKRRSIIQPGTYHITEFNNGLYKVVNDKNKSQLVPRYKLSPI